MKEALPVRHRYAAKSLEPRHPLTVLPVAASHTYHRADLSRLVFLVAERLGPRESSSSYEQDLFLVLVRWLSRSCYIRQVGLSHEDTSPPSTGVTSMHHTPSPS
ncbi:hypothetical protein STEG23_012419 [Scotinomys teguina]